MAKHLHNGPCPSCGSRDNLATYDDGSCWCWGCHYYVPPSVSRFVTEREYGNRQTRVRRRSNEDDAYEHGGGGDTIALPRSAGRVFTEQVVKWLGKYGVSVEEAISSGIKYSGDTQQLLFPFSDKDGTLCCIQAKNFNHQRAKKAKYYNIGDKNEHWTIYGKGKSDTLVLTEDALSSLIIGRQSDAMPLLGTSLAKTKLMAIKACYKNLVVWLDEDKWREARAIADAAKLVGLSARTVLTPKDPKEYSNPEIMEYLK